MMDESGLSSNGNEESQTVFSKSDRVLVPGAETVSGDVVDEPDLLDTTNESFKSDLDTENDFDLNLESSNSLEDSKDSQTSLQESLNNENNLPCSSNVEDGKDCLSSSSKAHSEEQCSVVEGLSGQIIEVKRKELSPPKTVKRKQMPVNYQSQISPDQQGIKLYIKKSLCHSTKKKVQRVKCKPKKESKHIDEKRKIKMVRWKSEDESDERNKAELREQSDWGLRLPVTALHQIFLMLTYEEGCLPFLSRMGRVCRLWREVAIMPSLWHSIDLSGIWYKEKCKNSVHFKRLCENRLTRVRDLNLGGWKVPAIQNILEIISKSCQDLRGLNVSGWKRLGGEHLKYLITDCPLLSRFDLSNICPESINNKGALSLVSLTNLAEMLGDRLTQLILANNRLSGLPQIVTALSNHCPNLQVLDLSNMKTGSVTTAPLHIEKLQVGCTKLRVLRFTNSQIALSQASLKEQAASLGFPMLEELSVAGIGVDGLCSNPIVDDNSIERILKSSHKLRLLDVRGCTRITDSSLVRIPAWDLQHLFLSGCYVTRLRGNGLELIAQKWRHSLIEIDLAWSTATAALDLAVTALAECEDESCLRVLDLCGSSVNLDPVKKVLKKCPYLVSLNLTSCRALPRGIKRLYKGDEVNALLCSLNKPVVTQSEDETTDSNAQHEGDDGTAEGGSGAIASI